MKKLTIFYLLSISCIFISSLSYSQEDKLTTQFELSFYRHFRIPLELKDSCSTTATFLRLYVNSNFKVSKIEFSKSASLLFVESLIKSKKFLNTVYIEDYSQKKKLGNYYILIPVFFERLAPICPSDNLNNYNFKSLTSFSDSNDVRRVYLADPIKVIHYPPLH